MPGEGPHASTSWWCTSCVCRLRASVTLVLSLFLVLLSVVAIVQGYLSLLKGLLWLSLSSCLCKLGHVFVTELTWPRSAWLELANGHCFRYIPFSTVPLLSCPLQSREVRAQGWRWHFTDSGTSQAPTVLTLGCLQWSQPLRKPSLGLSGTLDLHHAYRSGIETGSPLVTLVCSH